MQIQHLNIAKQLTSYFAGKPVKKAYLFGSYARNENKDDSDIDILLDIEDGVGLLMLSRMRIDISAMLHQKVDIVTSASLSPRIKIFVDADKQLIYEKQDR